MPTIKPSGFPRVLLLLGAWMLANTATAQSFGTLTGQVLDSITRRPIPMYSVFLANTMIGEMDKEGDGSYVLPKIPAGKYDLVFYADGYKLRKIPLEVNGEQRVEDVFLQRDTPQDKDETVQRNEMIRLNPQEYAKAVKYFTRYFIGETRNASKCRITNLMDIQFHFFGEILVATCSKPVVVLNEATGFKVWYWLDVFSANCNKNSIFDKISETKPYKGAAWFEEYPPQNNAQVRHWNKARERAYHGSITEFMRCLKKETLSKNHYRVFKAAKMKPGSDDVRPFRVAYRVGNDRYAYYPTSEKEVLDTQNPISTFLEIMYDAEPTDPNLSPGRWTLRGPQTSVITFLQPGILPYENGYFDNPENYEITGYMGWAQNIAEILPMEYQPR